ncbi:hypothetical protein E2562_021031 [Oryza meyeriana var. granulata]|uniref:Uncharacterized protein n=1 Tax=Oryza meyeriana var. granulata TaxID=110450 RepID=A0A6G1FAP0_9ORYZ|nr:hypothetical protein E2562_021031 [Oryza meyeriana var. granulata]
MKFKSFFHTDSTSLSLSPDNHWQQRFSPTSSPLSVSLSLNGDGGWNRTTGGSRSGGADAKEQRIRSRRWSGAGDPTVVWQGRGCDGAPLDPGDGGGMTGLVDLTAVSCGGGVSGGVAPLSLFWQGPGTADREPARNGGSSTPELRRY